MNKSSFDEEGTAGHHFLFAVTSRQRAQSSHALVADPR